MARVLKSISKPRKSICLSSLPANKKILPPRNASANEMFIWYQMHRSRKFIVSDEHAHTFFVVVWILCARTAGISDIRESLHETYDVYADDNMDYFFDEVLKKWGKTYVKSGEITRLFSKRFGTKVRYHGDYITFEPGNMAYHGLPDMSKVDDILRVLFAHHFSRMTTHQEEEE